MSNFQWTDEAVKTFAMVYCGNFPEGFKSKKYIGKKMSEKVEVFKEDYTKMYNRYVVVSQRQVFHKYVQIKVQVPDSVLDEQVDEWLSENEDQWVDKLIAKAKRTDIEYGFGLDSGMEWKDQESEIRYDVIVETPKKTQATYGGHL